MRKEDRSRVHHFSEKIGSYLPFIGITEQEFGRLQHVEISHSAVNTNVRLVYNVFYPFLHFGLSVDIASMIVSANIQLGAFSVVDMCTK